MTPDEYWHGPPGLAKAYREAYKIRANERNEELWRQGLYIYDAVSVAIHNNINLSGKNRERKTYMSEPLRIFAMTEEEKKQEQETARKEAISGLKTWGQELRRKFDNGNRDK